MILKIKRNIECVHLIRAIDKCRGNVTVRTGNDDTLNLKSELSRLIFVAAFMNYYLDFDLYVELSDRRDSVHFSGMLEGK